LNIDIQDPKDYWRIYTRDSFSFMDKLT